MSKALKSGEVSKPPFVRWVHFAEVHNFIGFSLTSGKTGSVVKVLVKAGLTSDDKDFSNYIEQISNQFFHPNKINPDYVTHFVILLHEDGTGDLYYGTLPVAIEARAKNNVKKGQMTYLRDIADVRRFKFNDVDVKSSDKVICLFKNGWKFGLYFDLDRQKPLDLDGLALALGSMYKELLFHHFFALIGSGVTLQKMMGDGWFPFIDLIPDNFLKLKDAYKKGNKREKINEILDSYNETTLKKVTDRWWALEVMKKKRSIIQSGVNLYIAGGKENYIASIKTLISEIEGIVRLSLDGSPGLPKGAGIQDQISYVIEKEVEFSGSRDSLLTPDNFLKYLNEEIFKHFDFGGDPELSRHSVAHGAAGARKYTRARALQVILTIDQLYFMIKSALMNEKKETKI